MIRSNISVCFKILAQHKLSFFIKQRAWPGIERVASGSVIPGEEFLIRSGNS